LPEEGFYKRVGEIDQPGTKGKNSPSRCAHPSSPVSHNPFAVKSKVVGMTVAKSMRMLRAKLEPPLGDYRTAGKGQLLRTNKNQETGAPVRRIHEMPFGAQCLEDGAVRFRIWAPDARKIEVLLVSGGLRRSLRMRAVGNGFFETISLDACPGDLYYYSIDDELQVPDPASRFNPSDVQGPSQIVDPRRFEWADRDWHGRPWREVVIYEVHVGAFTPEGTFGGLKARLDYLEKLCITAIELMPIADFPGARNWGYDGVLPYAPDASYGRPQDLKSLIQSCHRRGLMIFLDVVYNHFGPEGNYLAAYAPGFFNQNYRTPWGDAINFECADSRPVRDFYIHNALYWLEEFHFDGLHLDTVHAITDHSNPDIMEELADAIRRGPGRERHCHLILENFDNKAAYLTHSKSGVPNYYDAQWNDDWHHAIHVLLTGEQDGYYSDYSDSPAWYLGRCLTEGFGYQGVPVPRRTGAGRAEFRPPGDGVHPFPAKSWSNREPRAGLTDPSARGSAGLQGRSGPPSSLPVSADGVHGRRV
jgi:maltooligosyltrehalose trehalohydrolase